MRTYWSGWTIGNGWSLNYDVNLREFALGASLSITRSQVFSTLDIYPFSACFQWLSTETRADNERCAAEYRAALGKSEVQK